MKIGFIGAGNMATGLGKHWVAKGHELFFSHSRDEKKLRKQAATVSPTAKVGTAAEAAQFADILVLCTQYDGAPGAIQAAGDLTGKLLWSIVNPLKADFSGLQVGTTTSGAEELAKHAPGARFVAALPPFAEVLHTGTLPHPAPSTFVCTDDEEARRTVLSLVADYGGDGVNAGPLFTARFYEPALMGLVYLAYVQKLGGQIGLHLMRT